VSAPRSSRSPAVSIVIAAYNVAPYIGETLVSVARQGYRDYETIVVNDGSTDETEQAVRPFRSRLVYVAQDHGGLGAARNHGLRLATGRYITLLDADDVLMPNYLEKMVSRLDTDPQIDLLYPNAILFGSPRWEGKLFQDLYPSCEPVSFERLLTRECTIFVSATFRRMLLDRVGVFDESLREGCEDFDLWLRMARHGARFAFTIEPLVRYRQRPGSLSSDDARMSRLLMRVYQKQLDSPEATSRERELVRPIMSRLQARLDLALAKQMILARDFPGAIHHLALARRHYRTIKLAGVALALRFAPGMVARWVARQRQRENGRWQPQLAVDTRQCRGLRPFPE
jgi:glycosyltransferase involved in cell wall biosynthesis